MVSLTACFQSFIKSMKLIILVILVILVGICDLVFVAVRNCQVCHLRSTA